MFSSVFALRVLAERCLELEAVGRWIHTFSRCPVSVAACSEAEMNPGKASWKTQRNASYGRDPNTTKTN